MADIDPYAVLGVAKDASLPEIKSAHRKRVLKCHPDKIKEESLRNQAQDEFQRVQHAYETLSDPSRRTKHDQKVRLAELRREMKGHQERSQARANAAREYRDGRIYEERKPASAAFGGGDDDDYGDSDSGDGYGMPEEPRATFSSTNRKYDDWGSSRRTSRAEERKKPSSSSTSTPRGVFSSGSPFRSPRPRDSPRGGDSARTYHSSRAKYRTKERQREAYDKYAVPAQDSDYSDSSASSIYEQVKRSATESRRAARPPPPPPVDEDDYLSEDPHKSKHDIMEVTAQDYIKRSKRTTPTAVPVEVDPRGHRPSRSPSGPREYESRRSKRSSETVPPSNSRSGSYEHLDAHPMAPPRLPREATSPVPGKYGSRPHPMRSATTASGAGFSRSKRDPDLFMRGGPKRQDSGYSSPGAADMGGHGLHGTSPPKQPRYNIVTREPDGPPHSSPRYQQRGFSPPPPRSMPVRSKTFAAEPSASSSSRAARATPATSATRPLFGQVSNKDIKYNREYGPGADVQYRMHPRGYSTYDDYPESSPGRRQSAFA